MVGEEELEEVAVEEFDAELVEVAVVEEVEAVVEAGQADEVVVLAVGSHPVVETLTAAELIAFGAGPRGLDEDDAAAMGAEEFEVFLEGGGLFGAGFPKLGGGFAAGGIEAGDFLLEEAAGDVGVDAAAAGFVEVIVEVEGIAEEAEEEGVEDLEVADGEGHAEGMAVVAVVGDEVEGGFDAIDGEDGGVDFVEGDFGVERVEVALEEDAGLEVGLLAGAEVEGFEAGLGEEARIEAAIAVGGAEEEDVDVAGLAGFAGAGEHVAVEAELVVEVAGQFFQEQGEVGGGVGLGGVGQGTEGADADDIDDEGEGEEEDEAEEERPEAGGFRRGGG